MFLGLRLLNAGIVISDSYILHHYFSIAVNPLNAELHPIGHLPALLGAHHILHISR